MLLKTNATACYYQSAVQLCSTTSRTLLLYSRLLSLNIRAASEFAGEFGLGSQSSDCDLQRKRERWFSQCDHIKNTNTLKWRQSRKQRNNNHQLFVRTKTWEAFQYECFYYYLNGGKNSSDIIYRTPLVLEDVQAYTPISINCTTTTKCQFRE